MNIYLVHWVDTFSGRYLPKHDYALCRNPVEAIEIVKQRINVDFGKDVLFSIVFVNVVDLGVGTDNDIKRLWNCNY